MTEPAARTSEDVALAWARSEFDRLSPVLQRAVDRTDGLYRLEHVWDEIEAGTAQIWPGPNSIVITKVETYPTGLKTLFAWLAAGEMSEVLILRQNITAWARRQGCTRFYIVGRRGWLGHKAFSNFREGHTLMFEEI